MATEPITLFARIPDPNHAIAVLREVFPKVNVSGDGDTWREAEVLIGVWPFKKKLTVSHDPAYYSGENWDVQMEGMRGYLSRFPEVPERARASALTRQFGFALGTIYDPDLKSNDYRFTIISILASELEAVMFTPSSIRDCSGRILFSADINDIDPSAKWPSYG